MNEKELIKPEAIFVDKGREARTKLKSVVAERVALQTGVEGTHLGFHSPAGAVGVDIAVLGQNDRSALEIDSESEKETISPSVKQIWQGLEIEIKSAIVEYLESQLKLEDERVNSLTMPVRRHQTFSHSVPRDNLDRLQSLLKKFTKSDPNRLQIFDRPTDCGILVLPAGAD